jgi:hypothetical protein
MRFTVRGSSSFKKPTTRGLVVAVALALGLSIQTMNAQIVSAQTTDPDVVVKIEVRGTERTASFAYGFEAVCTSDGKVVASSQGTAGSPEARRFSFALKASETRTLGRTEFPTLVNTDSCTVSVLSANGAAATYMSTQTERADGSRPDVLPGLLDGTGFRSSPARANGQTITSTLTFAGDLQLALRVEGAPEATRVSQEMFVRCDNSGYSRSVVLGNGERTIITGIPVGSVCKVSTPMASGSVRYSDNSENPNDATVTILQPKTECLDLRNTAVDCRAELTAIATFDGRVDVVATANTENTTSTTTPDQNEPAKAAPATAAAAVAPAPATPQVSSDVAFTG